ncbi:hypothetical protein [Methylorubrum sp. GM97]|uniref:hypothetical protein n=1 Tax=Methylorubrum sp. GM97 TaxID=2938232 RepID=UPI0021C3D6D8|nr:hypothetical protein [Methylorubrum sp. GM97]
MEGIAKAEAEGVFKGRKPSIAAERIRELAAGMVGMTKWLGGLAPQCFFTCRDVVHLHRQRKIESRKCDFNLKVVGRG